MARSFAVRLALSFAAVGVAAALLTAVLVNLAFDRRFDAYVSDQRQQGQEQLVAALESSYRRADEWQPADLGSVGAAALMNGLAFSVEDVTGRTIWSSLDEATTSMAMMHRDMMGLGRLGPERRLPIEVGGQRVGLAVVRLPDGGLRPQDLSLRASINSLLATGGRCRWLRRSRGRTDPGPEGDRAGGRAHSHGSPTGRWGPGQPGYLQSQGRAG